MYTTNIILEVFVIDYGQTEIYSI